MCDDRGSFRRCGFATARIDVKRNEFTPVFQRIPYTVSIVRNAKAGSSVINTEAIDQDLRVCDIYFLFYDLYFCNNPSNLTTLLCPLSIRP